MAYVVDRAYAPGFACRVHRPLVGTITKEKLNLPLANSPVFIANTSFVGLAVIISREHNVTFAKEQLPVFTAIADLSQPDQTVAFNRGMFIRHVANEPSKNGKSFLTSMATMSPNLTRIARKPMAAQPSLD